MPDFTNKIRQTKITLREVGLREGLQSHSTVLTTDQKVELFRGLVQAGCKEINAVSFVGATKMPQMADAENLLRAIAPYADGIDISGLVPNERGLDRALAMKAEGVLDTALMVFSISEEGMRANGMTASSEQLARQIERSAAASLAHGLKVVVFISGAFGDNFKGRVDPKLIIDHAANIAAFPGVDEILISDSTGHADPLQIHSFFTLLAERLPVDRRIGLHMHDTRGAGLANIAFALASPFEHFVLDSSFGGWGGDYPFVDDSFGNVPTEDLVEMLIGMGFETGIDVDAILKVTRRYADFTGRGIGSKLHFSTGPLVWKREQVSA